MARPAAPLTAYLVGVAVGRGVPLADAVSQITALAAGWADRDEEGSLPDSYGFGHHAAPGPVLP